MLFRSLGLLRCWLAIARAPGLHADHLRPALARVGSPLGLWRERPDRLRGLGLPSAASVALADPPEARIDADLAFLQRSGSLLLPCTDPGYPVQLAQIPCAPAVLHVRGDPAVLGEQMERLHRVAFRVVWVNPLKVTPGYAPLARGMAAALPHVDAFVEGHSLAALEQLTEMIHDDAPTRARADLRGNGN